MEIRRAAVRIAIACGVLAAIVGVGFAIVRARRRAEHASRAEAAVPSGWFEARVDRVVPTSGAAVPPEATAAAPVRCPPEPPLAFDERPPPSATEIVHVLREHPDQLGSASIGSPIRGELWHGVELAEGEGISRAGQYQWGTANVVHSIQRAVREVRRCHPGTPVLSIGDISRKNGGWLRPHRSHQSGLDADIGYYYSTGPAWFVRATDKNFDAERTWALVRALIEGGNVEYVFMDRSVQRLVEPVASQALPRGVTEEDIFPGPVPHETLVRHEPGHATHFHVRFRDPAAAALGARLSQVPKPLYASKKGH